MDLSLGLMTMQHLVSVPMIFLALACSAPGQEEAVQPAAADLTAALIAGRDRRFLRVTVLVLAVLVL